jgi:hypothetical protein
LHFRFGIIANDLQLERKQFRFNCRLASLGFAAVMIFLVLLCGTLASNPSLHHLIHKDADAKDHECAVSLFAHGQVNLAGVVPVVSVPFVPFAVFTFSFTDLIPDSRDYFLLPGRAPPILLS